MNQSYALGDQWDDGSKRKSTRVHQPPGGQSKGILENKIHCKM